MTAPSTYQASPYDNRKDDDVVEVVTGLDVLLAHVEEWTPRRPRTSFAARYVDVCASCAGKITPGDEVEYGLDDQLEHVDCPGLLEVPAQGTCGGCSLVLTPAGKCSGWCE